MSFYNSRKTSVETLYILQNIQSFLAAKDFFLCSLCKSIHNRKEENEKKKTFLIFLLPFFFFLLPSSIEKFLIFYSDGKIQSDKSKISIKKSYSLSVTDLGFKFSFLSWNQIKRKYFPWNFPIPFVSNFWLFTKKKTLRKIHHWRKIMTLYVVGIELFMYFCFHKKILIFLL